MKELSLPVARPRYKTKPMSESATVLTVVGAAVYAVGGTVLIFFQQMLQKSNIFIPDKYMLFAAVSVALFGGVASYALSVQQKKEAWTWSHLFYNVAASGFVAMMIGLFTDGYISYQWWLGLILASAFFKNVFLALIPKALEQKTKSILNIEDTRDFKTTTTRRTTRTSEPGE
jgi:hypothetical protein